MKSLLGMGVITLGLAAAGLSALPDRTYRARDLDGTYDYNMIEIQGEPEALDICDQYGTITFDGVANAVVTSTRKCSASGTVTETEYFTYTVSPDGEVLIYEIGWPEPTHGRIVDKGNMILVDSTTRELSLYVLNGVAVKRR